ncbi:acetyl-CoA C-acyltransferase [Pseudomonas aeruginosa]|nr:acetyl-CoA C-acyltransferase [Pseudomonas aeruginosa]
MLDAYIYAGLRTPFGRHAGASRRCVRTTWPACCWRVSRKPPGSPSTTWRMWILGCTNQAGEDSRNLARNALLAAGLPARLPGQTVNRLCASGLSDGDRRGARDQLRRGPAVPGRRRRKHVPGAVRHGQGGERLQPHAGGLRQHHRRALRHPQAGRALWQRDSMPETGDNVARAFGIDREDADRFPPLLPRRATRLRWRRLFLGEILPVEVRAGRKGETRLVERDEHPRPQADLAALARLPALFAGGVVTAGNASGINDGAAVVLLGDRAIGEREGIRPLARILASASVGVEPRLMGIGPQQAILRALQRAGIDLDEVGLIEINEAFAPQVLACLKLLGLDYEDPRVNPHGGAIALGHPLGASGARLVLTAARGLQRIERRYAVVSLCVRARPGRGDGDRALPMRHRSP